MFFSATFADAGLLQKTIAVLHDLVNECSATITATGMSIQAMDSSHVCLIVLEWPADRFTTYSAAGPAVVGVHVGNLLKILKCSNKSDSVTIAIDDAESDVVRVSFHDEVRTATFDIKLMNRDDEQLGVPEFEHAAVVTMPSIDFQAACRDLSTLSDTTSMTVDASGLTLTSSGDIGTATLVYPGVDASKTTQLTQSFALRYLNSFARGSVMSSNVTMKMSPEMPLVLAFENEVSNLTFYLAPKIDDDLSAPVDED
jgi:proliferating cell nuclear antigen